MKFINNKTFVFLNILILLYCCAENNKPPKFYSSETLTVEPLNTNVFVHVSYLNTNDFGKVPCNGMVYFNEDEAIIFDSPTDNHATKELIDWVEKVHKKKIAAVVVTHFHKDCWGGLRQFHDAGIKSFASQKTIDLLAQKGLELIPEQGFVNDTEIAVGTEPVFIKYFGEGHTVDNVVGYIPYKKALFGGCLVKSLKAGKGNLEDANESEWANTVEKIKQQYPDLQIVVPGHGKSGGIELLDYTIQLFK